MGTSITQTIGRGTAWLAASTLLLKGVGFFSILIILNYLTVFEYGVAELVQTAVPLLSLMLLPGLNTTVIADMGRERSTNNMSRMKGLLVSYFKLQFMFAMVAWVIVFFGAHALAVWYGKGSTVLYFQIISFLFLLSPIRNVVQTVQSVFLAFRQQSLYNMFEEGWKLVLVAVFFFIFHMRIEGLLFAVVLCQVFALICILRPLRALSPEFWATRGERLSVFHFLYHHGKWGVFSNYVGAFGKNIRPWVINLFLGPTAVGIYAVVQGLIGHVVSLVPLDSVIKPLLPQYMQVRERFYMLIAKAIKYELLGYTVAAVASAIGVPFLVFWFFPQYVSAIPLFQIMLLLLISTAFDTIFSGVFFALQAQRNLFWASVYKLVVLLALLVPCIYLFGLFGVAYAVIVANSLYVWERYRTLKRLMPGFSLSARSFFSVDEYDRLIIQNAWRSARRTLNR